MICMLVCRCNLLEKQKHRSGKGEIGLYTWSGKKGGIVQVRREGGVAGAPVNRPPEKPRNSPEIRERTVSASLPK